MSFKLILFFLFFNLAVAPVVNSQSSMPVRVSEGALRKSAAKTVMPQYPEESRKHGARGVVVAELEHNGKGDVIRVDILESPDSFIKQAVIDAVKQWKFRLSTLNGEPLNVQGKLTFYYVIDAQGVGRVENPKQFK